MKDDGESEAWVKEREIVKEDINYVEEIEVEKEGWTNEWNVRQKKCRY